MKRNELKETVINFITDNGKKFEEEAHFENGFDSKYITPKAGTFGFRYADARCGNRCAIVIHGKRGVFDIVSGYLTPYKLCLWMLNNKLRKRNIF